MPIHILDHISLNSPSMRNTVSDKRSRGKKNTFLYSIFYFENRAVYEITWKKHDTAGQATEDNMAHAHCMPYT
jgi:hypothetical protein